MNETLVFLWCKCTIDMQKVFIPRRPSSKLLNHMITEIVEWRFLSQKLINRSLNVKRTTASHHAFTSR